MYISVDLARHEIFCAKVGEGGINCTFNVLAMSNISSHVTRNVFLPLFLILTENAAIDSEPS